MFSTLRLLSNNKGNNPKFCCSNYIGFLSVSIGVENYRQMSMKKVQPNQQTAALILSHTLNVFQNEKVLH